ncbi:MAG: DUF389 domain-containing protein [Acidimicrobiales bacterium]
MPAEVKTSPPKQLGWLRSAWAGHRSLEPAERRRVMAELAVSEVWPWARSFAVLLTLSVLVAVMGLSANSAAVVIGAMLIAPLMGPVLAVAASLAMTLRKHTVVSLVKVVAATVWSVALAYGLSRALPGTALSAEALARTQPDVRDLLVALAAGAAGAYATVRRDVSAALPGVAVAVALVPPLATVGISLEAGKADLVAGAFLLYITNLAAIVFAGVMVFVATGFVPARRITNRAVQLLAAVGVTAVLVVAIAVPLYGRSAEALQAARREVRADEIVAGWLGVADLDYEVDATDQRILVTLRGADAPPDEASLRLAMEEQVGESNVVVQWLRTERPTTTTSTALSADQQLVATVEPVVRDWLDEVRNGSDYELQRIVPVDGVLRIELAGTGKQPSADQLVERLTEAAGSAPQVRIIWTQRETITPGTTVPSDQVQEESARAEASQWCAERNLVLESLTMAGGRLSLTMYGVEEPDITSLLDRLTAAIGPDVPVDVFFVERRPVTTTTTPATTTTTSTTTSTTASTTTTASPGSG